jgi:hypothetical protein
LPEQEGRMIDGPGHINQMRIFNFQFRFRDHNRIAHVHVSAASEDYTLYFTDVELILEFGNKAKYSKREGVRFFKSSGDAEVLKDIISKHLEADLEAIQDQRMVS